jgi:predicted Zn-dependent protease
MVILTTVTLSSVAQETKVSPGQLENEVVAYLQAGKVTEAIQSLKKWIANDPTSDEAWLYLAHASARLADQKAKLACWDEMIKAQPSSAFARLFKAMALYGLEQLPEAEAELTAATSLGLKEPLIWAYVFKMHIDWGQYEKAKADYLKYEALGGHKLSDKWVKDYDLYRQALERQFRGINLPPPDWQMPSDFLIDSGVKELNGFWLEAMFSQGVDAKSILGGYTSQSSARYKFEGSDQSPFEYAPGLYIWDAVLIQTPEYGVLLANGSRLKWVSIVEGVTKIRRGIIKGWKFHFDNEGSK